MAEKDNPTVASFLAGKEAERARAELELILNVPPPGQLLTLDEEETQRRVEIQSSATHSTTLASSSTQVSTVTIRVECTRGNELLRLVTDDAVNCTTLAVNFLESCSTKELADCLDRLPRLTHLHSLGITTSVELSSNFLMRFLSHMPGVTALRVSCGGNMIPDLRFLNTISPTIRRLHLLHSDATTREIRHVLACANLESLRFTEMFRDPIDALTHSMLSPGSPTHKQLGVLPKLIAFNIGSHGRECFEALISCLGEDGAFQLYQEEEEEEQANPEAMEAWTGDEELMESIR